MTDYADTSAPEPPDNDFHEKPPADDVLAWHYAECFCSPAGQAVVADLSNTFGGNPFQAGAPDVTAFRCGCLKVVEHILTLIAKGQS